MTPEGKVKAKVNRQIAKLLKTYKFMPVQNGMGAPGLDYYLCVNGHFVALETKKPGGKLTPRQETTAETIRAAGGLVFVIFDDNTLDDAFKVINELDAFPRQQGARDTS